MTQTPGSFDHAAVARAHAVVVRAAAGARQARPVLDLVVAHLPSLLDARQCFVMVLRGDQRVRMVASHGLTNPPREVLARHDRDSLAMTAMTERRPMPSADVLADPAVDLSPMTRGFIEAQGYRATLAVPLIAETRVLGALVVTRTDVGAWTSAEVDLAQAFADHATVALERERLSSLDVARAEFDEALADVERQLLAELSVERLLPLIVDHARRAISAEGSIYVADPDRRWLQEACTSWPEPQGGRPFGIGVSGVCAETRRGVVVNDYPAWSKANAQSLARGARHVMAEPFLSRGRLLGVIAMARRDA